MLPFKFPACTLSFQVVFQGQAPMPLPAAATRKHTAKQKISYQPVEAASFPSTVMPLMLLHAFFHAACVAHAAFPHGSLSWHACSGSSKGWQKAASHHFLTLPAPAACKNTAFT